MADFASAFAATMKADGGYINDPQCPGSESNERGYSLFQRSQAEIMWSELTPKNY